MSYQQHPDNVLYVEDNGHAENSRRWSSGGDYSDTPRCRPSCHDTEPPCITPMTSRPSWRSMTRRHGTSVNSWLFSMMANLPLDSWTVPVNLPLTASPSVTARNGNAFQQTA